MPEQEPALAVAEGATLTAFPIGYDELASINPRLVSSIPAGARKVVAVNFATVLSGVGRDDRSWLLLQAFPKLVLWAPTSARGGSRLRAKEIMWRANMFSRGEYQLLIDKARRQQQLQRAAQAAAAPLPIETRFPIDESDPIVGTDVSADAISAATARRAIRQIRKGAFSRGASALNCVEIAAPSQEVADQLRALHPQPPAADGAVVVADPEVAVDPFGTADVRKALSRFAVGSAAGPSGLLPGFLSELVAVPGSVVLDGLTRVVNLFCRGEVPAAARPFVFGARLSALKKKGGGVRPVACGEAIRRLSARCLSARVRSAAASALQPFGQVGVGVSGGLEGLVHAARAMAAQPPDGCVGLKIDLKNAFNSVHRAPLLDVVSRELPQLLPYAKAAYGTESHLFFGEDRIASASGVQQGDPLGPLFFSLLLAHLWAPIKAACPDIVFSGWYLDDGFVVAPPATLEVVVSRLQALEASSGLTLNLSKCELVGPAEAEFLPEITIRHDWSRFELLGAPCGSSEVARREYLDARVRSAIRKLSLFSVVARQDPHAGLAVTRYCGGFALLCFYMRLCGSSPSLVEHDEALVSEVLEHLSVSMTMTGAFQASLPIRFGGLGLRPTAPFAAAAAVASAIAALPLAKLFTSATLPVDQFLQAHLLALPPHALAVAACIQQEFVKAMEENKSPVGRLIQKRISAPIDESFKNALAEAAGPRDLLACEGVVPEGVR